MTTGQVDPSWCLKLNKGVRMHVQNISHMLNFNYEKTSDEIKKAAAAKALKLKEKIKEREARISKIREENGIDDKALIQLYEQLRNKSDPVQSLSYHAKSSLEAAPSRMDGQEEAGIQRSIPAGIVSALMQEGDLIKNEKSQIEKLDLICRNLKDSTDKDGKAKGHQLNNNELEYLDF